MAKNYRIYINDVLMPVTPESIITEVNGKNEIVELIDGSDYNIIKPTELTSVSMTLLIPARETGYTSDWHPQQFYLDLFEKLKTDKNAVTFPFMIIRSETQPSLSDTYFEKATLENYSVKESSDYGVGDLAIDLEIKKFVDIEHGEIKEEPGKNGGISYSVSAPKPTAESYREARKRVDEEEADRTIVRKNETLYHIAARVLGDGERYDELKKYNPGIEGYPPNFIPEGTEIIVKEGEGEYWSRQMARHRAI